ncbi:hypothetical protein AURDEDRAFT_145705 [Auricularia subglabra TFB-10046 SS5]|nr:hypothetical protein AURDEDRAFT_145705 [Auricularia subglabra TFB-10046 SS5]
MSDQNQDPCPGVPGQIHDAFNFEDADVTLRSRDDMLFRVHKARLATVSAMFRDMFENGTDDADVVNVNEDAQTLGVLLPMCYPATSDTPPVDFEALDHAQLMACYEASCKYDMWVATQLLRRLLVPLVNKDPFNLVRVAFLAQDQDMTARAAKATLELDILKPGDEFQEKAGLTWPALLQYHMRVKREINQFMRDKLSCTIGSLYSRRKPCDIEGDAACDNSRGTDYYNLQLGRTNRDLVWELYRGTLANRPTAQLPQNELIGFIDRMLDVDAVRACSGCRSTWQGLKQDVYAFQPTTVFEL